MHEVLVNRLGGLSLPRKSVVRLTDRPDMTSDVYRGRKTTIQQYNNNNNSFSAEPLGSGAFEYLLCITMAQTMDLVAWVHFRPVGYI